MSKLISNFIVSAVVNSTVNSITASDKKQTHNWLMIACCLAMIGGFAYLLWSAPAGQSLGSTITSAFPLLICIGAHFVMHRFMGKSCHSNKAKKD